MDLFDGSGGVVGWVGGQDVDRTLDSDQSVMKPNQTQQVFLLLQYSFTVKP